MIWKHAALLLRYTGHAVSPHTRTPDGRRHYNVEIGGGNAFAVFDGAELPTAGERQHVNHLAYRWTRLRNLTPPTNGSRTMGSP